MIEMQHFICFRISTITRYTAVLIAVFKGQNTFSTGGYPFQDGFNVRNVKISQGFYFRIEGIRRKFYLSLYKILWWVRDILAKTVLFCAYLDFKR